MTPSLESSIVKNVNTVSISEYQNIDHTLDEIDSWMTKLEEQNDNLFSELEQLLESNRQARKELQEQQKQDVTDKQQNPKEPMEQDGSWIVFLALQCYKIHVSSLEISDSIQSKIAKWWYIIFNRVYSRKVL